MADWTGSREEIQKEIAAVLLSGGFTPPARGPALNVDDRRRATEIAKRIIESNFDKSQIAELDRGLLAAVAVSLREIMSSSQELGPIRALEEINPYYTPFGSALVRD